MQESHPERLKKYFMFFQSWNLCNRARQTQTNVVTTLQRIRGDHYKGEILKNPAMTRNQNSIGSGHPLGGSNLRSSGVNVKRPGGSRSIGSGHRLDGKKPDGSRSTGS